MEWLREWAMAICTASVFGAAVTLLAPEDRYEKIVNMCVSVFVLAVAAAPVSQIHGCAVPEIELDQQYQNDAEDFELYVADQSVRCLSLTAQELIDTRLSEKGIDAREICVIMDTSEDGCISIGQVKVTVAGSENTDSIRAMLSEWLGTEKIEVTGGKNG